MRIVYCLDSICGIGGIQRVTLSKAGALAGIEDNQVWIITSDNTGESVFPVPNGVIHIDLGVNYYSDDWKSRWNVLKGIFIKRRIHRKRLEEVLHRICPDVVIGVGQSEKNFLPRIKGDWRTVREYHYARDYRWKSASDWFGRLSAIVGDLIERFFTLGKYDRIVVLTNEDKDTNWKGRNSVSVIPNPITIKPGISASLDNKRIIAVGRLTFQKNFASLIRAFSVVAGRYPDWILDILGEGPDRIALEEEIKRLCLTDRVFLRGRQTNVSEWMRQSSIFTLTSRFEGFSLALLEAMGCGLPVVSYACPCGPKDIVTNGVDGFLVTMGDEADLAECVCRLIEDKQLRIRFGTAAKEFAQSYCFEKVTIMWMNLFQELRQKT